MGRKFKSADPTASSAVGNADSTDTRNRRDRPWSEVLRVRHAHAQATADRIRAARRAAGADR